MLNGLHLPGDQSKESGLSRQQAGCRLDLRWDFQGRAVQDPEGVKEKKCV